jgi:hypothetical protein
LVVVVQLMQTASIQFLALSHLLVAVRVVQALYRQATAVRVVARIKVYQQGELAQQIKVLLVVLLQVSAIVALAVAVLGLRGLPQETMLAVLAVQA